MSSSLIMRQKVNTGHYGPAPTVNVIQELDGNRVKLNYFFLYPILIGI